MSVPRRPSYGTIPNPTHFNATAVTTAADDDAIQDNTVNARLSAQRSANVSALLLGSAGLLALYGQDAWLSNRLLFGLLSIAGLASLCYAALYTNDTYSANHQQRLANRLEIEGSVHLGV